MEPERSRKARTPSPEEDEGIEEMVRHSREQRQQREQGRARSKSRSRRRRRARSLSRFPVAEHAPTQKQSFIPAGYENTRREELQQEAKEELQREAKQEKEWARQNKLRQQAEKTACLEEKLRDEVFNHQKDFVDRAYQCLKAIKLPAADPRVRCLWIFGGGASSHTAQVLAIFDWASKYFKLGGEYPVPRLPGWLTTFISVTSLSRFPDGLPQLPTKRTAMNFPNKAIHSPGTWQWMADLLQYWSDVSNTKTQGGLSRTPSPLVEELMEVVNPHFPAVKERITWDSVAFGTFHWLEARTGHTRAEKADYERQLKRNGNLNELEIATQRLWQDWMQADELNRKRCQVQQKASRELPPERRAAQLEREKQAKITGLHTSTHTEERYPGWVVQVCKKPGADTPTPYKTPRDLTTEEHNAALGAELGADDLIDPLVSPAPPRSSPGPQTPPQFTDADIEIPSIAMPPASPVTHAEDQLLEAEACSPMIISSSSASTVSTPTFSRAPGSTTSSARGTPMSEVSPLVRVTPPPGLGQGVCRYAHEQGLPQQTAFADAMRHSCIQEDPEDPIPKEDDPDWM